MRMMSRFKRFHLHFFLVVTCVIYLVTYQLHVGHKEIPHIEIKQAHPYEAYPAILRAVNKFDKDIIIAENSLPTNLMSETSVRNLDVAKGEAEEYFSIINHVSNIKTVFFKVTTDVFYRIVPRKIYATHANDCHSLMNTSIIYRDIYNLTCTETPDDFSHIDSSLNWNISKHYNIQLGIFDPFDTTVSLPGQNMAYYSAGFLHVIQNAYITALGDVVTNGVHIQILQCRRVTETLSEGHFLTMIINTVKKYPPAWRPFHKKVFSIAQYWGESYYHIINEDLPRMAIALSFLWENTEIKIHVVSIDSISKAFIQELGISSDRLVSGHIEAGIAYVPAGTDCGIASIVPINLMSMFFRSTIAIELFPDTIILIKRSAKRWFDDHDSILRMLKQMADPFRLRVQVFGDRPPPSVKATKYMFNRAVMVVAPHGAGLSNMVFSQPETCIIEGLCRELEMVNLCFKHTAQALGHVYYGVVPRTQCMQTTAAELAPYVKHCLRWKMTDLS